MIPVSEDAINEIASELQRIEHECRQLCVAIDNNTPDHSKYLKIMENEKKEVSIAEMTSAKMRLEQTISDLANAFAQKYGLTPCHLEIHTNHITPIGLWVSMPEGIKVEVTIKI